MFKVCRKCGVSKEATSFYNKDSSCKECRKKRVRENRLEKEEYYKEYDRNRYNRLERNEANKQRESFKYKTDPEYRIKSLKRRTDWGKRNPHQKTANTAVSNAIRDGKLFKPDKCSRCPETSGIEGHHWCYREENWLNVIWLCTVCHGAEHKRLNEIERLKLNKQEDL